MYCPRFRGREWRRGLPGPNGDRRSHVIHRYPHPKFRFYAALSKLPWPKSYFLKILAICFVGTHIPLIATVIVCLALMDIPVHTELSVLLIMLAGTVVAAAATVFVVRAMLAPVSAVTKEMERYRQNGEFHELPATGTDEAAMLMRTVNSLLHHVTRTNAELETQSNIDALVGIGNRRWLLAKAELLLTRPSNDWAPTTVAIIDLDNFKAINDTAGHAAGDDVLKKVGAILLAHSRPADMVGRLGGDEFCIFFPRCDVTAAATAVERMRKAVLESGLVEKYGVTVSLSAGLTSRQDQNEDLDDTLARADHALYAAKSAGRNRIEISLADRDAPN